MDIRGAFLLARVGFFFTPQFPSISTEGECVIGFTATVELLHRGLIPPKSATGELRKKGLAERAGNRLA